MYVRRRHLLAGTVSLGSLALAGCQERLSPNQSAGSNGTPDSVVNAAIETTETTCGTEADEHARIEQTDRTVTVTGAHTAPNPCHETVLERISFSEGLLSVDIGVESTRADDEVCIECVGLLSYEVRVELATDTVVESVSVSHESGGTYSSSEQSES